MVAVNRPRRGGPGRPVDQAQPDRLGAGRFVNLVLGQIPPPAPGPGYYGFGCLGPNVAGETSAPDGGPLPSKRPLPFAGDLLDLHVLPAGHRGSVQQPGGATRGGLA